jgi:signal-transduction protein with cAMP-binding, CBS, and nucleotidyltransferase domain
MPPSLPNSDQKETDESVDDLLASLKKLPVFRGVSVDAIRGLLSVASNREVRHGEFVFKQNEPGSSLVIFNKGLGVEFKRSGSVDCLINFYNDIAVFGESCFMESTSRSTSLFANEDCLVCEIDNRVLKKLANLYPDQLETFFGNLGRELGRKASITNDKIFHSDSLAFVREASLDWDQYE